MLPLLTSATVVLPALLVAARAPVHATVRIGRTSVPQLLSLHHSEGSLPDMYRARWRKALKEEGVVVTQPTQESGLTLVTSDELVAKATGAIIGVCTASLAC